MLGVRLKDKVETLGDLLGLVTSSAAPEIKMSLIKQLMLQSANSIAPDINTVFRAPARLSIQP